VPSGVKAILSVYNAEDFLGSGVFQPTVEKKREFDRKSEARPEFVRIHRKSYGDIVVASYSIQCGPICSGSWMPRKKSYTRFEILSSALVPISGIASLPYSLTELPGS
jgi:hypothetical protein